MSKRHLVRMCVLSPALLFVTLWTVDWPGFSVHGILPGAGGTGGNGGRDREGRGKDAKKKS